MRAPPRAGRNHSGMRRMRLAIGVRERNPGSFQQHRAQIGHPLPDERPASNSVDWHSAFRSKSAIIAIFNAHTRRVRSEECTKCEH
jgi:hypothetical protein